MKRLLLIVFIISAQLLHAQNNFKAVVKDKQTKEWMKGVTVIVNGARKSTAITDSNGVIIISNIAAANITVQFSYVGYKTETLSFILPDTAMHFIFLEQDENALHAVTVISSTRSNEKIETATTKVEVLGIEEMNEESTIKPGNIASIIGDYSGIQIQQSSAVSGNANVRIQGLDGKYTQILRDGMPLYEGYSGGFGILSIPPLDLKQIELIKGAASTLYGGGAIAGLINLVSKKPAFTPDASFLINQTTLKETNINAWYAQRWKHVGFAFFAAQNFQKQVDVNNDGFSDVPNTKGTLIHPAFFIYPSSKSYISLSWSGSFEKRTGGDMIAIADKLNLQHPYFEENKLGRNTFTLIAENHFNTKVTGTVKASFSAFNRDEKTNTYFFSGRQNNFYSEASAVAHTGHHTIVGGINFTADDFKPSAQTPAPIGNFSNTTSGIFVQDTWRILEGTKLETGLRLDHHIDYGNFLLPRIALFQNFDKHWGMRAGFGMGYKTPNPLTTQIKDYSIYNLLPIAAGVNAEKSYGGNFELNYKKEFGEGNSFFINQAFFITRVQRPVVAEEDAAGNLSFYNEQKNITTKGSDTYIQAAINRWEIYLGYTYTNAERNYLSQNKFVLFTPRHRAAAVVSYEIEGEWRFGIEASYTGYQYREDFSKTPGYVFTAAMIMKNLGPRFTLVLNCENVLDERQSKYETLYTGSIANPQFKTLWAPIDGRVANLSLRFQPFAK